MAKNPRLKPRARQVLAVNEQEQNGGDDQPNQQKQRRTVRGGRYSDQQDQAETFTALEQVAVYQQKIKRQDAEAAEDVGDQERGQPWQYGHQR